MEATENNAALNHILEIGRSNPEGRRAKPFYLEHLDFSVVQQCIHCGMCLPTCPTYDTTKLERNSPRGRIALMRAIAEGNLEVSEAFGEEMYFCLGCLACETACPAGVKYAELFENARADIERAGVLKNPKRRFIRAATIQFIFTHPNMLRALGWLMWVYQAGGFEALVRKLKLTALLPESIRELEPLAPRVKPPFSDARIAKIETPNGGKKYRVGMLTGCVQDLVYADINRDTVDVLLANGCEVVTPRVQFCCGSLHAHNGELELSREMCRRNIAAMERAAGSLDELDAIITNAAGCGSHLKNYAHLLHDDPQFAERAKKWSAKLRDVHEWLCEIGITKPEIENRKSESEEKLCVTYHEACHLCHGQKITKQPREVLKAIPNLELVELPESTWCCGSAGIYNITQPEMSRRLLERKLAQVDKTGAPIVATSNPGCMVQLECGVRESGRKNRVVHTISLLAQAYRESENRAS